MTQAWARPPRCPCPPRHPVLQRTLGKATEQTPPLQGCSVLPAVSPGTWSQGAASGGAASGKDPPRKGLPAGCTHPATLRAAAGGPHRGQSYSQAPPSSTQRTPEESVIKAGSSLWVLPTLPRTPPGQQQHPQPSPSMSPDAPRSRRNRAALHIPQRKLKTGGASMALERRPESHEACAGTWAPRVHTHAHTLYTHTCVYLTRSHTHVHTIVCSPGPLMPTAPLA